jgi:predicted sulfurtransferase
MDEAEAGGFDLISTEKLAELYQENSSDLLLVDTRQEWEYRTGTIEGALNFSMEPAWWARWRKAGELEDFLGPDKERVLFFF